MKSRIAFWMAVAFAVVYPMAAKSSKPVAPDAMTKVAHWHIWLTGNPLLPIVIWRTA